MKNTLITILLTLGFHAFGQIDTVDNGSYAGSGDGEALYSAFQKVNEVIKVVNSNIPPIDSTWISIKSDTAKVGYITWDGIIIDADSSDSNSDLYLVDENYIYKANYLLTKEDTVAWKSDLEDVMSGIRDSISAFNADTLIAKQSDIEDSLNAFKVDLSLAPAGSVLFEAGDSISYNSGFTWDGITLNVESDGQNTFIGNDAGFSRVSGGNGNLLIGYNTGYSLTNGDWNAFYAANSGYGNTTGTANTFIGVSTGSSSTTGDSSVYVGFQSGQYSTGNKNVFIGALSGRSESSSNKLYIDNSSTSTPLIYGEFDNDSLVVNGVLTVTDGLSINGGNVLTTSDTVDLKTAVESETFDTITTGVLVADSIRVPLYSARNYINGAGVAYTISVADTYYTLDGLTLDCANNVTVTDSSFTIPLNGWYTMIMHSAGSSGNNGRSVHISVFVDDVEDSKFESETRHATSGQLYPIVWGGDKYFTAGEVVKIKLKFTGNTGTYTIQHLGFSIRKL